MTNKSRDLDWYIQTFCFSIDSVVGFSLHDIEKAFNVSKEEADDMREEFLKYKFDSYTNGWILKEKDE